MSGVFLDSSVLDSKIEDVIYKQDLKVNKIQFEFPKGFTELRLIEECRALNALDITVPENFDLMYDITMQMLVGKGVQVYYNDILRGRKLLQEFIVTDRYMNLRSVPLIGEYPIIVNWLVEFVAGYLSKKYPRSYEDFQAKMSEKEEHTKKSLKEKNVN